MCKPIQDRAKAIAGRVDSEDEFKTQVRAELGITSVTTTSTSSGPLFMMMFMAFCPSCGKVIS